MTNRTVLWPNLKYRDARAAIRFLVDVVGFEEMAVYGDGDVVDHCELRWPAGGGVMLGSMREDSAISDLPPGVGSIYIVVDNPDELHDRIAAAGVAITQGLRDEDYGSRGFTCRDAEGVYWNFGTYPGVTRV